MRIEVTNHHIYKGKQRDKCNCPISLAIKDKIVPSIDVFVSRSRLTLYNPDGSLALSTQLSSDAKCFITNYDIDEFSVQPVSFDIEIPAKFLK